MKISKISLNNYRGFKNLKLNLHPKLTVIVGINGCGKTTMVSGIKLLLWSYIRNFKQDLRRGSIPSIKPDDVYHSFPQRKESIRHYPCSVKGKLDFSEGDGFDHFTFDDELDEEFGFEFDLVGCELKSENSKAKWLEGSFADMDAASKRMDIAFEDLDRIQGRTDEFIPLPLVASYGTNRLWRRSAGNRKVNRTTSRFAGYDGAVSDTSNFLKFEWFIFYLIRHVNKDKATQVFMSVLESIESISGWTMKAPMPGEEDLIFSRQNETMKLSQLGDGVRCMIGLVGDLACRCAMLNMSKGRDSVKSAIGVVLIDEIDLHLHPAWQQTILSDLQMAFPRLQFIVTTHSPQVLSTVHKENIRIFERTSVGDIAVSVPIGQTYGEPSGDVLQSVMMVDPQPPVQEKIELQRLTELIDNGRYDEPDTIELTNKLTLALGEQHPQLLKLRRSINRQRMFSK
ncbi:AAA family ATPase [Pseudomonas protegens]|uniref:AAA family ATPase n=1 Tax=Pseudomonas protegens TaxID=380021 RepID=UPI0009BCDA13|nr:AAA family ATPase [Pseudomonas protegens]